MTGWTGRQNSLSGNQRRGTSRFLLLWFFRIVVPPLISHSFSRKITDDVSSERKPTLEEIEALLVEYDTLSFEAPEYTTLLFFIKGAAR